MALWGRLCNSRISSQEYHDERFNRHLPIFFERPFKKIGRWCLIRKKRRGFDIHHRSLKPHPLSFIKRKIITLLNAEEHRKSALMKIETCFGGMMQRRDFTAPHHCIQRMHSSKTKSVKCENDLQFEQALGIRASERAGLLFQDAFSCGSIDAVFFPPFPSLCSELRGRAASAAAVVVGAMRLGAHFFWLVRSVQKGQVHFADEIVTRRNFLAQDFLDPHKPNSA